MNEETEANFIKAGKISGEALAYGRDLIKKGVLLRDVCDKVDAKIIALGGKIAFPSQTSLNHIAAHYCPTSDDETKYEDQVIKLDIGAHIEGCVTDNAVTVDLSGKYADLVKASKDALAAAIKISTPGTKLRDIGKAIEETIKGYGFEPIRNLSGHGIGVFKVHEAPTVPNFDDGNLAVLKEGQTIAIEPFATDGEGAIYETGEPTVFMQDNNKPVRDAFSRELMKEIKNYQNLPFTKRWLEAKYPAFKVNFGLKNLAKHKIIKEYPPLVERKAGMVSQAEKSVLVKDKPVILTPLP